MYCIWLCLSLPGVKSGHIVITVTDYSFLCFKLLPVHHLRPYSEWHPFLSVLRLICLGSSDLLCAKNLSP